MKAPSLRLIATTSAVACLGAALVHYLPELGSQLKCVDPSWLTAAFLVALIYRLINASGWTFVLRAMGHPMPLVQGTQLWLVAETLRWLPGSIWGYTSRVTRARDAGVPAGTATLSLPLELVLTVGAWCVVALGGLLLSGGWREGLHKGLSGSMALLLGGSAALAVTPWVILRCFRNSRIAGKISGLLGNLASLSKAKLSWRGLFNTLMLYLALCILNGIAFHFILVGLTPVPPSLALSIGVNAVGWIVGFAAIAAPGGIGAREGAITLLLAPTVGLKAALAAVVLWRGLQLAVELLCLAACMLSPWLGALLSKGAKAQAQSTGL